MLWLGWREFGCTFYRTWPQYTTWQHEDVSVYLPWVQVCSFTQCVIFPWIRAIVCPNWFPRWNKNCCSVKTRWLFDCWLFSNPGACFCWNCMAHTLLWRVFDSEVTERNLLHNDIRGEWRQAVWGFFFFGALELLPVKQVCTLGVWAWRFLILHLRALNAPWVEENTKRDGRFWSVCVWGSCGQLLQVAMVASGDE